MPLSSSDPAESSGLRGDMYRAHDGAIATTAELREFVRNLRGKSPQEVLGAVANSGLAQGVALATFGTVVLMAVFTIVPYYVYGGKAAAAAALAAKKEAAAKAEAAAAAEEAAKADATASKAKPAAKDASSNAQQTLEKMGESETKQADPKVNPLDNLDDLLESKK